MNKKLFIPFVMGIIFLLFSSIFTANVAVEDLDIRAKQQFQSMLTRVRFFMNKIVTKLWESLLPQN